MQQICAGRRLAERKNGEQTVADKFQYFPAMSHNRLRHRVEKAVQKINDVIARPVVGDPGEIASATDKSLLPRNDANTRGAMAFHSASPSASQSARQAATRAWAST